MMASVMRETMSRIRRVTARTAKGFASDCSISPSLAMINLAGFLTGIMHLKRLSRKANIESIKKKKTLIRKMCAPIREQCEALASSCGDGVPSQEDAPIWVCWWTGEEDAPEVVKRCLLSIKNHSTSHPVHIVTQYNVSDYLEIPNSILGKIESGTLCLANFSDYLRFSLLSNYGGIWIDATVFLARDIPEEYFYSPIFTANYESNELVPSSASRGRWTPFFFAAWKDNVFAKCVQSGLSFYWTTYPVALEYLLVDYIMDMVYEEFSKTRHYLDELPYNNLQRNELAGIMLSGMAAEDFDGRYLADAIFFKLSWREAYPLETADGRKTVFAAFLDGEYDNGFRAEG